MKVGIIVSTPLEAKVFGIKKMNSACAQLGEKIVIACCGPGKKGVDKAMLHMTYHDVQGLISWGFAGGIVSDMTTGKLVIPKQIIHPHGPTLDTNHPWHDNIMQGLEELTPSTAPIMHSDDILKTKTQKTFGNLRTHAVAVDQESFYVASWAHQLRLPMLSVRVILDDYMTTLPGDFDKLLNDQGQLNKKTLIKILANPTHWHEMIRLQNQYRISQKQLRRVVYHPNQNFPF